MKPLAIDLFCGLGGWTDGLLAEGWDVIGFDIEEHDYGDGMRYPAQLVLQDVLTIHGRQFKDVSLIVASPPCQEFSYMAMPWSRAKQIAAALRGQGEFPEGYTGSRTLEQLKALFDACFRIQREAIEAAGRFIPLVVENVRGACVWVGRSRWNYASFHLWGDVPALMPLTAQATKVPGFRFDGSGGSFQTASVLEGRKSRIPATGKRFDERVAETPEQAHALHYRLPSGQKTAGHINRRNGHGHTRHLTNQREHDGVKQPGISGKRHNGRGDRWFQDGAARHGSKSDSRKAASAAIAKIPLALSQHIARVYKPQKAA